MESNDDARRFGDGTSRADAPAASEAEKGIKNSSLHVGISEGRATVPTCGLFAVSMPRSQGGPKAGREDRLEMGCKVGCRTDSPARPTRLHHSLNHESSSEPPSADAPSGLPAPSDGSAAAPSGTATSPLAEPKAPSARQPVPSLRRSGRLACARSVAPPAKRRARRSLSRAAWLRPRARAAARSAAL